MFVWFEYESRLKGVQEQARLQEEGSASSAIADLLC